MQKGHKKCQKGKTIHEISQKVTKSHKKIQNVIKVKKVTKCHKKPRNVIKSHEIS